MDTRRKAIIKTTIGSLILLGFVVFIEHFVGWAALLAPWQTLPALPMAAAIILVFCTYGLRALRVHDYFHAQTRGRFTTVLNLTLQHNLLNNLLPMRTGELSFPLLMQRRFLVPAQRSVPALLWFRFLDLHSLVACGLVIAGDLLLGLESGLALALAWMLIPWLAFRLYTPWTRALEHHPGKWQGLLHKLLDSLPQQPGLFWRSWLLTLVNWLAKLAAFAWVLGLFIDTSVSGAWVGVIAGDLTSVLPIHGVAGAGTYEAGVVAGLLPFKADPKLALQAAVNLHLFLLGSILLGGLLTLLLPARHPAPERP